MHDWTLDLDSSTTPQSDCVAEYARAHEGRLRFAEQFLVMVLRWSRQRRHRDADLPCQGKKLSFDFGGWMRGSSPSWCVGAQGEGF